VRPIEADLSALIVLLAAPASSAFFSRRLSEFYHRAGPVRQNYRGRAVSAALGPALLLGYLPGAAAALWLGGGAPSFPVIFLWSGFAFLGLWDDLIDEQVSGFKGHFGAARQGKFTAGFLKAVTALLVGLIFAAALPLPFWSRLGALLLVLLSANGVNLFDRRPGRALKVFFGGALLLIFLAGSPAGAAGLLLPLLVGALAVAPLDLGAAAMLGDCGANLLGAALGTAAVLYLAPGLQALILIFWATLHLFSEFYSISRLVESSSFLRRLDRLGRFREKLS
jgi:UDP-N-acetylmuramyl pentapeptide phosphotransferase/UDP-N-acetylglucosamine-1-phosphate transferase